MRFVVRFLASFALTLLVALPSTAFAAALNLCTMTPNVIRICRCPEHEVRSNVPALGRSDCCLSQAAHARQATSSQATVELQVPAAALIARVSIFELQPFADPSPPSIAARSRAPPSGLKTYLRTSRILS